MTEEKKNEEFGSDFKSKTLEWAASMVDCKPSPRLEFIKQYIGMLTSDELTRLKKMVQITKRKVIKVEKSAKKSKKDDDSNIPPTPEAATSSFNDAANSSGGSGKQGMVKEKKPWWSDFKDEDIIAWDSEYVSCLVTGNEDNQKKRYQNKTATLDVVNTKLEIVKSYRIYHQKGSFQVTPYSKFINGFSKDTFDKKELPKLEDVKKEMDELFKKKLVITCGGIHDFGALGLSMGDYDHLFDLQSHWFHTKYNEYGTEIREPHSLRSLTKHYLKEDAQTGKHTSLEDAINTMKLFDVYKRIKLEDDPDNLDERLNIMQPYNKIDIIPSAVKTKFGKKKKQPAHQQMQ